MSICGAITQGADYNCQDPIQPGLEPQIILMNKDDIASVTIVDNKITNIALKAGKTAYLFEGDRQSINASFEHIEQGVTNGYSHNLMFQVYEIGTSQKLNLEKLAIGNTVGITFNMDVPGNADGYFEVFGIGAGMEAETLTRINRDLDTGASFSVSLKTSTFLSEAKIPMNFFDTDYTTTLNKILGLLVPPIPGTGFPYTLPYILS